MKRIKFKTKYFLKANFRYLHNFFKPKNMYDIYTHILIHRHTNTHIYIYIHTYIYIYIYFQSDQAVWTWAHICNLYRVKYR